jgi:hypothetical protein
MRFLRVMFLAAALAMVASNLPAPLWPDCNNQPDLNCGMTCTQDGCIIIVTPDESHYHDFCYRMSGSNCMGGSYHKCCE